MKQTIHNETLRKIARSKEYKVALMIRLTRNFYAGMSSDEILRNYEEVSNREGVVWLGSNALASGMGKKRRQELMMAIGNGKKVHIYFINEGTKDTPSEIVYRGEVVDLESRKGGIPSPEAELTPECYHHKKCSIWLKLTNLAPYTEKKVADFQFVSNHKLLKDVINTNCSFGYITECGQAY